MKRNESTVIEKIVYLVIVAIVLTIITVTALLGYVAWSSYSSIKKDGLKGTIEKVWVGEKGNHLNK